MEKTIKSIDVEAKEWFDKSGGNSYFSAEIDVKFEDGSRKLIKLPFQYGYETQFTWASFVALQKAHLIPLSYNGALWRYCQENNILLTTHKKDNCTKKQVKDFGNA